MSRQAINASLHHHSAWGLAAIPSLAGLGVAIAAYLPPWLLLATCAGILYVALAVTSAARPIVFVTIFLISLILLPPLFFGRFGETPFYVPSALLPIAVLVFIARFPDFQLRTDPVSKGLACFLGATALSLPFGWWISGVEAGTQGLMRWSLLAQALLFYSLVRGGALRIPDAWEKRLVPTLMIAGTLTAAFGIVDFIWPVPIAHPAADQYIWLAGVILRRAQGVFYESSNFANHCAFFLAAISAAFLTRQESVLKLPRAVLLLAIPVLWTAILLAFSRGVWANLLVTLVVFGWVSGRAQPRRLLMYVVGLIVPLAVFAVSSPELWNYLFSHRIGSLFEILDDPNLVSSWRLTTLTRIGSIFQESPYYFLFGVGYKTLPHSRVFQEQIITDNGYLNLLLETGIVGLSGFLFFIVNVLKSLWKIARETPGAAAFWGLLLFSFWCGELVELTVHDAYTYWRNMILFAAMMAYTANLAERWRADLSGIQDGLSHPRGQRA